MGDRAMAEIKTEDGSLYVYTHWGGYDLPNIAEQAIIAARGRWNDESYATRIIVDQLTKECRDKETGAGLMLKPNAEDEYNHDKPSVIIDIPNKKFVVIRDDEERIKQFSELETK